MTKQEAYEKMREWFLTDRRFGWDPRLGLSGACVYRAPDGARCAIGALIPDGNPMLACGGDISLLEDEHEGEFYGLFGSDYDLHDFLSEAQCVHDLHAGPKGDKNIDVFIADLDRLAREAGLQVAA